MKFGVREICDVTFKTTAAGQRVGKTVFAKAGMPAFAIDTAKTSSLEQATTTVYATGGKGNTRLISWEGEKTMTFTVEDALISPLGLAVLSGAGLIDPSASKPIHAHITFDVSTNGNGEAVVTLADLQNETGLNMKEAFEICDSTQVPVYATILDGSGAGIGFCDTVTLDNTIVTASQNATFTVKQGNTAVANKAVKLDFYLVMTSGITEINIKPEDFGGYFYVEAQTLFRREDSGLDMAAEIILPKVKVQSGFTFSMASTGDPSTFTFTMDAFPGYTQFDPTTKVMCVIQMIGTDDDAQSSGGDSHTHFEVTPEAATVALGSAKVFTASNAKAELSTSDVAIKDATGAVSTSKYTIALDGQTGYSITPKSTSGPTAGDKGFVTFTNSGESCEAVITVVAAS